MIDLPTFEVFSASSLSIFLLCGRVILIDQSILKLR
jgi:hypothetical protein